MYEKRRHQMLKMQVCDFEKEQKHKVQLQHNIMTNDAHKKQSSIRRKNKNEVRE